MRIKTFTMGTIKIAVMCVGIACSSIKMKMSSTDTVTAATGSYKTTNTAILLQISKDSLRRYKSGLREVDKKVERILNSETDKKPTYDELAALNAQWQKTYLFLATKTRPVRQKVDTLNEVIRKQTDLLSKMSNNVDTLKKESRISETQAGIYRKEQADKENATNFSKWVTLALILVGIIMSGWALYEQKTMNPRQRERLENMMSL